MSARTQVLPINKDADWGAFQWPSKAVADDLNYQIDATAWLADAGMTVVSSDVSWTSGLSIIPTAAMAGDTVVTLRIKGGTPDTVATIRVLLHLSGDEDLEVLVALPIRSAAPVGLVSSAAPANDNALTVGGVQITVAGIPIAI